MIPTTAVIALVLATTASPSPKTFRIVVLDISESMATVESIDAKRARRIDIARQEIRQLAERLPPSAENPIGLVLFNHTYRTDMFTDPDSLYRALDAIKPHGDTAISLGLRGGRELLDPALQAVAVFLLLYTDGENREADGPNKVAQEETALDAFFARRHERGLATHVVCKRWANVNDQLIQRLSKNPHWGLIDARDFRITSLTAVPAVNVESARWCATDRVKVTLRGYADVHGTGNGHNYQLIIHCQTSDAQGDTHVTLTENGHNPATFAIVVDPNKAATAHGRGELRFRVEPLQPKVQRSQVVIPQVPTEFVVPFDIPVRPRQFTVAATLKPKHSRWTDPNSRQATTEAELTIDIAPTDGLREPWPTPIHFLIEPGKGCFLVSGSPVVKVNGEGITTAVIALARSLPTHATEGELSVRLTAHDAPTYFTLLPKVLDIHATFPTPPPATTTVTVTAPPTAAIRWFDVGRELALFDIPLNTVVRGPTTNSRFTVIAPPTVHSISIEPSVLRPGEQTLRLQIVARCTALSQTDVRLDFVPPSATEAIKYAVADSINITLTGPPPVQLALADQHRTIDRLFLELPDTLDTHEGVLLTTLLDVPSETSCTGIRASLSATANLPFTIDPTADVYQPVTYQLRLPDDHQQNFWIDSVYSVRIDVVPDRNVSSIVGSTIVLDVVIPAPFKRWLFGFIVVVGVALLFVAPIVAAWRYHTAQHRVPNGESLAGSNLHFREEPVNDG